MDRKTILLVEDNVSVAEMYQHSLKEEGFDTVCVYSGRDALDYFDRHHADLALVDLRLPDMDGLELIRSFPAAGIRIPVIIMTGHGSVSVAVEAMRCGATDFLIKPFNIERMISAINSEFSKDPLASMPHDIAGKSEPESVRENAESQKASDRNFGGFIGSSALMQKIYQQISAAAKSNAAVFISGESGTGKEVCAEAIHKYSPRHDKPFIPINCAAIPASLMESELFGHVKGAFTGAIAERDGAASRANGGTLFLDEVAELTLDMQTKLLRFLQNYSFVRVGGSKIETTDVRIVCATNRNPLEEIRQGRFREDLFYRLHVLPVYMPPLRDRGDDIIDIAQTILCDCAREEQKHFLRFDENIENILRGYRWPGNIRQLQNVIRNIVVMHDGETVMANMVPPDLLHSTEILYQEAENTVSAFPRNMSAHKGHRTIRPLAETEREAIEHAISHFDGNISRAAAALGVAPSTIYRKKAEWEDKGKSGTG